MKKICPVCKTENKENSLLCSNCMEDLSTIEAIQDNTLTLSGEKFLINLKHLDNIGRNFQHELKNYKTVSRNHAKVFFQNGVWFIQDEGSTNGTFINDKQIPPFQKAQIKKGDIIKLSSSVSLSVT